MTIFISADAYNITWFFFFFLVQMSIAVYILFTEDYVIGQEGRETPNEWLIINVSGFLFYSSETKDELLVSLPKMEKSLPEIGHTTYICTQRGLLCKWISLVWAWNLNLPYYIIASPSYTLMQLGRKGNTAQSPINFSYNRKKLREMVEKYLGKRVLKDAQDNA